MTKAKAEFVVFDSADVIATSGNSPIAPAGPTALYTFGFESDGHMYQYTDAGKHLTYGSDSPEDVYANSFWKNVWTQQGDQYSYEGGTYSTENFTNVSKWLILNSDNSWSITDRTLQ